MLDADVLVIGGGIAGAGAAYEISAHATVIVLEREHDCGYHSTGRSAASFSENYGNLSVRRLAMASRAFLDAPPPGFAAHALLTPQATITIARVDQLELLERQFQAGHALVPSIRRMSGAEVIERVPILKRDYVAAAFLEPHSMEIDVHGLHQGFLRGAKSRGARVLVDAGVTAIERRAGRWHAATSAGAFSAPILVNAAGAWADVIARMAGIDAVNMIPMRRTAFTVSVPDGMSVRDWPMVDDVGEEFYFKPDAGQLFVSPADAVPTEPTDAYADDLDVAAGVERLERATNLDVKRVLRSWAGLRSFVEDGSPVVGFDPLAEGFLWLAAQGGYGIKTSPALSRACASLIVDGKWPEDLAARGVSAADLSPRRLRLAPAA